MFLLDPRLKSDTIFIKSLDLSELLLMNDKRFPWFILVPRREKISEIFELSQDEQLKLWQEILHISKWMKKEFDAYKMNVATLGNVVSQLHVHIIARKKTDDAWPQPVWGYREKISYSDSDLKLLYKITDLI